MNKRIILNFLLSALVAISSSLPSFSVAEPPPNPDFVDIYTGVNGSTPEFLTVFKSKLYFSANNGTNGTELMVYDGGNAPTVVADIKADALNSYPRYLIASDSKLFFEAKDASAYELWEYNGVDAPNKVTGPNATNLGNGAAAIFNSKLYFQATDGTNGDELWVYDGVNEPEMFMDINSSGSSWPYNMIVWRNKLYFAAYDGINGGELWVYDGITPPHMVEGADIFSGAGSSWPDYSVIFNDKLYFNADDDTHGEELWVYDGVNPPTLVDDINPGEDRSYPDYLTVFKSKLYFSTETPDGRELWVYDGINKPERVADIAPDEDDRVSDLIVYNSKLYFKANDGISGLELWVYDGINDLQRVADINSDSSSSVMTGYAKYMKVYNSKLYFEADDGVNGQELWFYYADNPFPWPTFLPAIIGNSKQ